MDRSTWWQENLQSVEARFEHWAHWCPERLAVVSDQNFLSYDQLNARANILAHRLHTKGIGPNKLVAVYRSTGLDLVTAILATWKAGGAFVLLDAGLEHLYNSLLQEASLLLAPVALRQETERLHDDVVDISLASSSCGNLAISHYALRNLAYIAIDSYKLVRVEQTTVIQWINRCREFGSQDRNAVLAKSVDAVLWQILPLTYGASLHFPQEGHSITD